VKSCQKIDRGDGIISETTIVGLNGLKQYPQVNFAALQHDQDVGAHRFDQLHLDIGVASRVPVQKRR
jgi:hypothetical protein